MWEGGRERWPTAWIPGEESRSQFSSGLTIVCPRQVTAPRSLTSHLDLTETQLLISSGFMGGDPASQLTGLQDSWGCSVDPLWEAEPALRQWVPMPWTARVAKGPGLALCNSWLWGSGDLNPSSPELILQVRAQ